MKKIVLAVLIVMLLLGAGFMFSFMQLISKPSVLDHAVVITIPEGSSVVEMGDQLRQAGIIPSTWAFRGFALVSGVYSTLPSGKFRFSPGSTIRSVVHDLASGQAKQELSVTLLEGWTISDMATYLSDTVNLYSKKSVGVAFHATDSRIPLPEKTYAFLSSKPVDLDLEGYLFPDTYRLFLDSEPKDLLEKMLDNFDQKVTPELRQAFTDQGLTLHQAVTFASLLEAEAQSSEDKKMVAGVLYNRLKAGMALQLDTTVIYATGMPGNQLTEKHLQTESPYNTYLHPGLPIGPICNPGLTALEAVAYPTPNDNLYFITDKDGKVYYSLTYEEHLAKKQQLYP